MLRSGDLKEIYELRGQWHSARAIPQELSQSRNRLLLNRKRVESLRRRSGGSSISARAGQHNTPPANSDRRSPPSTQLKPSPLRHANPERFQSQDAAQDWERLPPERSDPRPTAGESSASADFFALAASRSSWSICAIVRGAAPQGPEPGLWPAAAGEQQQVAARVKTTGRHGDSPFRRDPRHYHRTKRRQRR